MRDSPSIKRGCSRKRRRGEKSPSFFLLGGFFCEKKENTAALKKETIKLESVAFLPNKKTSVEVFLLGLEGGSNEITNQ